MCFVVCWWYQLLACPSKTALYLGNEGILNQLPLRESHKVQKEWVTLVELYKLECISLRSGVNNKMATDYKKDQSVAITLNENLYVQYMSDDMRYGRDDHKNKVFRSWTFWLIFFRDSFLSFFLSLHWFYRFLGFCFMCSWLCCGGEGGAGQRDVFLPVLPQFHLVYALIQSDTFSAYHIGWGWGYFFSVFIFCSAEAWIIIKFFCYSVLL